MFSHSGMCIQRAPRPNPWERCSCTTFHLVERDDLNHQDWLSFLISCRFFSEANSKTLPCVLFFWGVFCTPTVICRLLWISPWRLDWHQFRLVSLLFDDVQSRTEPHLLSHLYTAGFAAITSTLLKRLQHILLLAHVLSSIQPFAFFFFCSSDDCSPLSWERRR